MSNCILSVSVKYLAPSTFLVNCYSTSQFYYLLKVTVVLKSWEVDERNGIIFSECRVAGPVQCEQKESTGCIKMVALDDT